MEIRKKYLKEGEEVSVILIDLKSFLHDKSYFIIG